MSAFGEEQVEQLLELISHAGSVLQKDQFVEQMNKSTKTNNFATVLQELINATGAFFAAHGKDAEGVLNNISQLLAKLSNAQEVATLSQSFSAAVSAPTIKGFESSRLKILANLFNSLPKASPARFACYLEIISFSGRSNQLDAILSQLSMLPEWTKTWQCTKEQLRTLYRALSSALHTSGKTQLAGEYRNKLLQTYDGAAPAELAAIKAEVGALLTAAVANPEMFEYSPFLQFDAVKHLAGEPVLEVVQLLASGDLTAYSAWLTANGAKLGSLGLSDAVLGKKIRLLALSSLCAKQTVLDFATVAAAIQVPADDVESWIIDVIGAGLVEAKIDEVNEKVVVSRSTHMEFGMAQWTDLQKRLQSWSSNLGEVQTVLDGVRAQLRGKAA